MPRHDEADCTADCVQIYRFADIGIATTLGLLELRPSAGHSEPQIRITEDRHLADAAARSGRHLLSYPGLADFLVLDDGAEIAWKASDACSPETMRHLLLDHVLPRVLAHRGRLVLHAGAVVRHGQAVVLLGGTGSGKSTLVASLHGAGWPALGDDGLAVDRSGSGHAVTALYRGLRLWPSSLAGLGLEAAGKAPAGRPGAKRHLELAGGGPAVAPPIAAAFVLAPPPGQGGSAPIVVSLLSQREACMELVRAAFQLDLDDPQRAAHLLASAVRVAERVPVFTLSYPRDFARLAEVRQALERVIGERHAAAGCAAGVGRHS